MEELIDILEDLLDNHMKTIENQHAVLNLFEKVITKENEDKLIHIIRMMGGRIDKNNNGKYSINVESEISVVVLSEILGALHSLLSALCKFFNFY